MQLDPQMMTYAAAGLAVLAILFLIGLLGAQAARRRLAAELAEVEGDLGQLRADHTALQEELGRLRVDHATLQAEARRVPDLEDQLDAERDARMTQTERLRTEKEAEARTAATLRQELVSLRESHAARLEELRDMKKELEDRFSSLAAGVLKTNSETFLGLVSERFKQHSESAKEDLEKRQQAIQNLVKPLDEKLGQFDTHIREIEKTRGEAYGAIRTQVQELAQGQQNLGQETRRLVQALRAPKTRGRWGEMQLRQVFDMAGMTEHVDYHLEGTIESDAGLRRPDAVVHIPGGKSVVVDVKTPLQGYLDALEAETPELQQEQIRRHAGHIRTHVKQLASKAYQDLIETTPDFVVMFIPGETFVAAAAEVDPGIMEYAMENRVLIATPTTLLALIKAIAYGWQQEKMAENAAEVQRVARELYERLGVFAGHLDKIGRALGQSVEHYNRAVGSLEGRVLPSARKFEQMGVVPAQTRIDAPKAAEGDARAVTAPELLDLAAPTPRETEAQE